jgi:hypothetical protein
VSVNRDSGLSAICGIEMGLHAVRLRDPCGARDQFPCAHAQNLRKLVKLIFGPQAIPSTWSRNVNHLASSPASSPPGLPPGLQRNRAGPSVIADGRNAP